MPQTLLLSTTDRNCRPTWHKFKSQGKRVHHTCYTNRVLTFNCFEFCGRIFGQWPPIRKSPILPPTFLQFPHLYIYISLNFCCLLLWVLPHLLPSSATCIYSRYILTCTRLQGGWARLTKILVFFPLFVPCLLMYIHVRR